MTNSTGERSALLNILQKIVYEVSSFRNFEEARFFSEEKFSAVTRSQSYAFVRKHDVVSAVTSCPLDEVIPMSSENCTWSFYVVLEILSYSASVDGSEEDVGDH